MKYIINKQWNNLINDILYRYNSITKVFDLFFNEMLINNFLFLMKL